MRKLSEIPRAWVNAPEDEVYLEEGETWPRDDFIADLDARGYRPVSIDRAVVVIEQAEAGDLVPAGAAEDPLVVTVFPDPDLGIGARPQHLYIHASAGGLAEVFYEAERRVYRMVAVDADAAEAARSGDSLAAVLALQRLASINLRGVLDVVDHERGGSRRVEDEELAELGAEARAAIDRYLDRVRNTPDLFTRDGER